MIHLRARQVMCFHHHNPLTSLRPTWLIWVLRDNSSHDLHLQNVSSDLMGRLIVCRELFTSSSKFLLVHICFPSALTPMSFSFYIINGVDSLVIGTSKCGLDFHLNKIYNFKRKDNYKHFLSQTEMQRNQFGAVNFPSWLIMPVL